MNMHCRTEATLGSIVVSWYREVHCGCAGPRNNYEGQVCDLFQKHESGVRMMHYTAILDAVYLEDQSLGIVNLRKFKRE